MTAARDNAAALRKAVKGPASLTAQDNLTAEDFALVEKALDREIAFARAERAGRTVYRGVGKQRQRELLELARSGKFTVTGLSPDELRAIDNTPGIWDQIEDLW